MNVSMTSARRRSSVDTSPREWVSMPFPTHVQAPLRPNAQIPRSPDVKYQLAQDSFEAKKHRRRRFFVVLLILPTVALALYASSLNSKSSLSRFTASSSKRAALLGSSTFVHATPLPDLQPYEEHPIKTMMREAREAWDRKVAKQSKTLEEAEVEYRRRYGRNPPPGFDHWFKWAQANDVQLLDEYDTISHDIAPHFSLSAEEILLRVKVLEHRSRPEHAILHIRNNTQLPWTGADWRWPIIEAWTENIKELLPFLPDMDVAVFLHDGPFAMLDATAMQGYRKAANAGELVDESQLHINEHGKWDSRSRMCMPDSPMRRAVEGLDNVPPPGGPRFVADHFRSMDFCENYASIPLHGSTSISPWLSRLEPSFGMSRTSKNADLLWPATIQYSLNPPNETAFRDKKIHKLVWRGSPDGIHQSDSMSWRSSHRFRLIFLTNSNETTPTRPVRLTKKDKWGNEFQYDVQAPLKDLNERYSAVRPTNHAVQCDENLCDYVNSILPFAEKMSLDDMSQHRYVMDVDGNAYSARFKTHLLGNQVVFKSTRYPEWYQDRIQPWLHYVPISQDYSDLYNTLAFFDGGLGPDREGNHDDLAEEIALASADWAKRHWRDVDTKAYLFRLLLEYGRLLQPEREAPFSI